MTAAWITARAVRRPAPVLTHSPGSTGPWAIASASISRPPRALIAPATPAPIQKWLFAALTMASVASAAMSPSVISNLSGGRLNANKLAVARENIVGQREKCVAFRARRKHVEWFLRAFGELGRATVRIVERSMFLEGVQKFLQLPGH